MADDSDQTLGQLTGELHLPPVPILDDEEEEEEEVPPTPPSLPTVKEAPVPTVVPSLTALVSTAEEADVDAFLDSVPGDAPMSSLHGDKVAARSTLDESVIDDLLSGFESLE